ncbi:hypothetical protein QOM21_00715 [Streptomyces sp. Pv4-95]|uniref:hypothetical protein n=1 Tax=Streptomyces sp. Pv4-95 TaxID=3049543 RepID=UPI003891ECC0
MYDLRAEAEMRLHSEKTAKELALKKRREDASENDIDTPTAPPSDQEHITAQTTAIDEEQDG